MYNERLQAICKRYKTVVMLGDSMGASAALLFAPAATAVLAFCPQVKDKNLHVSLFSQRILHLTKTILTFSMAIQVDLSTSSIRPGKGQAWLDVLKENILNSVREAAAQNVNVMVHSGSWEHDVQQVKFIPSRNVVQIKARRIDIAKRSKATGIKIWLTYVSDALCIVCRPGICPKSTLN